MTHFDSCPICASSNFTPWKEVKDHSVSGSFFPICECLECTARFTQNIPSKSEIGSYYQSDNYISHNDSAVGIVHKLYHLVRSFTIQQKVHLIKTFSSPKTGNLFDVGSGTGAFLKAMKKQGWFVTGMEPDPKARNISLSKGIEVSDIDILEKLEANHFHVITLWHVLEHIHDLQKTLQILRKSIRQDGKILIAVPNYKSYDASFYGENWAAYDVPRHLYHFTYRSIELLLKKHGFELIDVKPMWFDSFYVSILSEKYRNGSFLKAVLIGFISNFKTLLRKRQCSSLIYICKPIVTV